MWIGSIDLMWKGSISISLESGEFSSFGRSGQLGSGPSNSVAECLGSIVSSVVIAEESDGSESTNGV